MNFKEEIIIEFIYIYIVQYWSVLKLTSKIKFIMCHA